MSLRPVGALLMIIDNNGINRPTIICVVEFLQHYAHNAVSFLFASQLK